jgi:hypothetical protein
MVLEVRENGFLITVLLPHIRDLSVPGRPFIPRSQIGSGIGKTGIDSRSPDPVSLQMKLRIEFEGNNQRPEY